MTSLKAVWLNPLRVAWERAQIETEVAERVVSLCGSTEDARKYHDEHYRAGQVPASKWDRLTKEAIPHILL